MIQTSIVLLLISFVIEIIALSTNSWSYIFNNITGIDTNYGILDACSNFNSTEICQDMATDTNITTSINYIRVLSIINLFNMVASIFYPMIFLPICIVLNIVIMVIFFTKVVHGIKQVSNTPNRLGYSSMLFFISTVLLMMAAYMAFNEK